MPAPSSLSILDLVDQVGGVELPNPITVAPRAAGGVGAGEQSPQAARGAPWPGSSIAGRCARSPPGPARSSRSPNGSPTCPPRWPSIWAPRRAARAARATIRRVVRDVDADRGAPPSESSSSNSARARPRPVGGAHWPSTARPHAAPVDRPGRRASRPGTCSRSSISTPGRCWAGSIDTRVEGKTSEISGFAPLLDTLTALDLTDVVITADALHTQREHVETLAARGAHWVLTVKGNQPRLRRQLAGLPWRQVEPAHRSARPRTAAGRSAP